MSNGQDLGGEGTGHGSPAIRVGRGLALVVVGVVLGVVLLHSVGKPPAGPSASAAASSTATGSTPSTPTTSAPAPTTTTTAAPARPPSQVKTLVANGTKTSGVGSKVSGTLQKAGYDVLAPTNATSPAASSAVLFTPGFAPDAAGVAKALGLAPAVVMPLPNPPPVSSSQGANVVVVVGPDLADQASIPPGSSSAPTTTTGPSTSAVR